LLVAIRKVISGSEEPPIREILEQTSIMELLGQIFKFPDHSDDIRIMKVTGLLTDYF
jgi:hypothetical protein